MADSEVKKDKFSQAINHYAEEQRKKIEDEISSFKEKELEEAEIEVLTECYRLIQKEMTQMRNGISREMAQREIDARRELLNKRQKIMDEVFQRASNSLKGFAAGDKYQAHLKKTAEKLAQIFHSAGTVVCLKQEDEKYQELIHGIMGDCTFQTDRTISIGGIRAYHSDMGIMADETLDTLLENQREWFEEHSGMTVV